MSEVEAFIEGKEGRQREILFYLRNMLVEQLGLIEKIRYKIPFFYNRSWICYLNPVKNNGVDLSFIRGNELSNIQGLLEARDRAQVRSIAIYSLENLPITTIEEIIQEAILLDETTPYESKNKSKRSRKP